MTRWDHWKKKCVETPDIDKFLKEVLAVCKKHGFVLASRDMYKELVVEEYVWYLAETLGNANVGQSLRSKEYKQTPQDIGE